MSDLRDLYQETILDHGRNPRHHHALDDADLKAEGYNPLCGDRMTVFVRTRDGRIEDIGFLGSGCAISMASASLMSEALRGMTLAQARDKFTAFQDLLTGKSGGEDDLAAALGKLVVFSGVCRFPVRIKCATLAWHTLRAAIESGSDPVSTE